MSDERIDPNEWTTKELVKHLYRELNEIKTEQIEIRTTLKLLENDLTQRKAVNAWIAGAVGFVGTIIGFILKYLKDQF